MLKKQKLWSTHYIRMCLSTFFQYLTHYVLIAALPVFLIQMPNQTESQAGLVLTFFQIGAILFRPLAGKWMDTYEKKQVLFASLSVFCAVCFMYLGVQTIYFLFILRFLHGGTFATGTTATATMVAIFSPSSRKGEGIGYVAVFTSIAMVVGPFLGLILIVKYSFTVLFAVCALFSVLAFGCGYIHSMPKSIDKSQTDEKKRMDWKGFLEPNAIPFALCGGILAIAYSGLLAFLPLYANTIGMMNMASYFFAVYALAIIISRPLIGKLFDRIGPNVVVYASACIYFVGMVALSQVNTPYAFLLAGAVIGIGFGGLNPSFQTLAILTAPVHKSGLATSTYFLSMDVGIGIGSLLLGVVANATSYRIMYLTCSALIVLLAVLFYGIARRGKLVPRAK